MSNDPQEPTDRTDGQPSAVALAADASAASPATASLVRRSSLADGDWSEIVRWASRLVEVVAADHPSQHIAVVVPDASVGGLRLAAQVAGASEDAPDDPVGASVVPVDGSVSGRVYRTGEAALIADASLDADEARFVAGRTRSSITAPVGPAGDVVAVISVESPRIGAFSVSDVDRLSERSSSAFATFPARRVA